MPREQVDVFMHALSAQESSHNPNAVNARTKAHGQWQILPSNWSSWAKEAGLGGNAPKTAANQRAVAKDRMLRYYDQFGSWDAVAVAWFAGPGRAKRYKQGDKSVLNLSDGNMTVGEYIAKMQQGMGSNRGARDSTEAAAMRRGQREAGTRPSQQAQAQRYGPTVGDVTGDVDLNELEGLDEGPEPDTRGLLTAVLQSVSDKIAGRDSAEGMMPDMLGPEPDVVPDEQLEPDALDGLGEQGGGFGTPGQESQGGAAAAGGEAAAEGGWALPTSGRWSSNFGQDRGDHKHGGIDISAPEGTPIVATKAGTVARAGWSDSYGWVVYVDHGGGVQTRYAHMVGKPSVSVGDRVGAGQGLGGVGNTGRSKGNHLHYEVRVNGKAVNPNGYHGVSGRFAEV